MVKGSGSVRKADLHSHRGAQRCNSRGEAQTIPWQAAPRSISGAISPKAHLHKPRDWASQALPSNNQPACSCPGTASAPLSGHGAHHWRSLGAALSTSFTLRALLLRGGTHHRMHTKHSSGLHRTYRMSRGRTKGREREMVRPFGEHKSEKERQVEILVSMLAWLCPSAHQHSLSCFLIKFLSMSFLGKGLSIPCVYG